MILSMIIKYRHHSKQQIKYFIQDANLQAEITKNEYQKKYGEVDFDFDFDKVDSK